MSAAEETTSPKVELALDPALEEMIQAGVFYGRNKSRTNPRVKEFVFGNRGGIEIIDLYKTKAGLDNALALLKQKAQEGALVLLVGTQPMAYEIEKVAVEFQEPVVTRRWLGGTLTNFKTINERVQHFKKLKIDLASGALAQYTKKERLNFEKEIERLQVLVGGLETLDRLPDVVVMIDPLVHLSAVKEAKKLRIPVIALCNTDVNPDLVDYCIVGNNRSVKSINWFLKNVADALREGKASKAAAVVAVGESGAASL